MNIEKIKDWAYENWVLIIVILIVLLIGVSAYNYNQEDFQECEEYDLINKLEEKGSGYIIYYSDGRIKEYFRLPKCIKLKDNN